MEKLNKVIAGMEACNGVGDDCNSCPYAGEGEKCSGVLWSDIRAVLEEVVNPARWEWKQMGFDWGIVCSNCDTGWWMTDTHHMAELAQAHKYCPNCGKPMVFEEQGDWVAQEVAE